ncbi:MAG TPA: hypothetical protein VKR61_09910 [Bryobacteraceae bacterium]|nr:hypothetical protein [Bryobacteraceae bacterium]
MRFQPPGPRTSFLPPLQITSVAGIRGITFLVTLVPSAIAVAWTRRSVAALAPAAIVCLAVLAYGAFRLQTQSRQPQIRVGLAATDQGIFPAYATSDPAIALTAVRQYAARVRRLAAEGAQVVIVPEKFVGVTVIAGFNRFSLSPPRNEAIVFAPDGRILLKYEKHHTLPGSETGYEIGTEPGLFPTPAAQLGAAIQCGVAICNRVVAGLRAARRAYPGRAGLGFRA